MAVKPILLLGDERLYTACRNVSLDDRRTVVQLEDDLRDTLADFRARHGFGRAIAAPQIGVPLRAVLLWLERPQLLLNPQLDDLSAEMMEVWDDCFCFPGLWVRVKRHKTCTVHWCESDGARQSRALQGDLSELLQHECDHLEGILAPSRAVDARAFSLLPPQRSEVL